jgi:hypothetical protein
VERTQEGRQHAVEVAGGLELAGATLDGVEQLGRFFDERLPQLAGDHVRHRLAAGARPAGDRLGLVGLAGRGRDQRRQAIELGGIERVVLSRGDLELGRELADLGEPHHERGSLDAVEDAPEIFSRRHRFAPEIGEAAPGLAQEVGGFNAEQLRGIHLGLAVALGLIPAAVDGVWLGRLRRLHRQEIGADAARRRGVGHLPALQEILDGVVDAAQLDRQLGLPDAGGRALHHVEHRGEPRQRRAPVGPAFELVELDLGVAHGGAQLIPKDAQQLGALLVDLVARRRSGAVADGGPAGFHHRERRRIGGALDPLQALAGAVVGRGAVAPELIVDDRAQRGDAEVAGLAVVLQAVALDEDGAHRRVDAAHHVLEVGRHRVRRCDR